MDGKKTQLLSNCLLNLISPVGSKSGKDKTPKKIGNFIIGKLSAAFCSRDPPFSNLEVDEI
jgi:hypothetical protein